MKLSSLADPQKLRLHSWRRWKALRRAFRSPVPSRPVFVLGRQRSGTSMLMYLLEMHSDTEVYDEAHRSPVFRRFRLASYEAVDAAVERSRAPIVCMKPICDSHLATELLERFPGARVVWLYRGFADAARSAVVMWETADRALRRVCRGEGGGGWFEEGLTPATRGTLRGIYRDELTPFECTCLGWWARNRIVLEQRLAGRSDVHLLRYENLVEDVEARARELFGFLGLPFQERVTRHVHSRSVRAADESGIHPDVRALCRELERELDELASGACRDEPPATSPEPGRDAQGL
jgi:hypothetical protein